MSTNVIDGEWYDPNEQSRRRPEPPRRPVLPPVSDSPSRLSGAGRELARVERSHQVDIAKARNDGRRRALERSLREAEIAGTIGSVARVMNFAEQLAADDPDKLDVLTPLAHLHMEVEAKTYRNAHDPDYKGRR